MALGTEVIDTEFRLEASGGEQVRSELGGVQSSFTRLERAGERLAGGLNTLASGGFRGLSGDVNQALEILEKWLSVMGEVIEAAEAGARALDVGAAFENLGGTAEEMERLRAASVGIFDDTTLQRWANFGERAQLADETIQTLISSTVAIGQESEKTKDEIVGMVDAVLEGFNKGEGAGFETFRLSMAEVDEQARELYSNFDQLEASAKIAARQMAGMQLIMEKDLTPSTQSATTQFGQTTATIDNLISELQVLAAQFLIESGAVEGLKVLVGELTKFFVENKDEIRRHATTIKEVAGLAWETFQIQIKSAQLAAIEFELTLELMGLRFEAIGIGAEIVGNQLNTWITQGMNSLNQLVGDALITLGELFDALGVGGDSIINFGREIQATGDDVEKLAEEDLAAAQAAWDENTRAIEEAARAAAAAKRALFETGQVASDTAAEMSEAARAALDILSAVSADIDRALLNSQTMKGSGGGGGDEPTFFERYLGLSDEQVVEAYERGERAQNLWYNEMRELGEALLSEMPVEDSLMARMLGFAGVGGEGDSFIEIAKDEATSLIDDLALSFSELQENVELEALTSELSRFDETMDSLLSTLGDGAGGQFAAVAASITDMVQEGVAQMDILGEGGAAGAQAFGAGLQIAKAGIGALAGTVIKDTQTMSGILAAFESAQALAAFARWAGSYFLDGAQGIAFANHTAAAIAYGLAAGGGGGGSAPRPTTGGASGSQGARRPEQTFGSSRDTNALRREARPEIAPIFITNQVTVSSQQVARGLNDLARQDRGVTLDSRLISDQPTQPRF